MAVFTIASGSLAACRYTLTACNPFQRQGKRFVSFPEGLKFVFPTIKPQSAPLLASFSSSRLSAQCLGVGLSDGAEPANARKPTSMGPLDSGFKRPEVIEWNKDIVNHITLMGILGRPVEIKYLDTGKVVANTSLKVSRLTLRKESEDMWFFLEFWDELAEIAVAHLKKLDRIFVSGSVCVVTYTGKDNLEKTLVKVTVKDLKYVNAKSPSYYAGSFVGQNRANDDNEEQWNAYFKNPAEWWDNRSNKGSTAGPDFKNKRTGYPLWIENWSTPSWVKELLEREDLNNSLQEGDGPVSGQTSTTRIIAQLENTWQEYFADSSKWWDYRSIKVNPRYPDFKNKITGASLWVDNALCPPWVKAQLAALDSKAPVRRKED